MSQLQVKCIAFFVIVLFGASCARQGKPQIDVVDVFLAGVAGRSFTDGYWRRIIPRLDPKVVVPTHYDNFFRPLGSPMEFVSNVKLSALPEEIGAVSGDAKLAALPRADL